MDVRETKNMDLFKKVHIFEPRKSQIHRPNISLISPMFNYAKLRIFKLHNAVFLCGRTISCMLVCLAVGLPIEPLNFAKVR